MLFCHNFQCHWVDSSAAIRSRIEYTSIFSWSRHRLGIDSANLRTRQLLVESFGCKNCRMGDWSMPWAPIWCASAFNPIHLHGNSNILVLTLRHPTPGDPRNSGGAPHHQRFHTSMMIQSTYVGRRVSGKSLPGACQRTAGTPSLGRKKNFMKLQMLLSELSMQLGSEQQGLEEWPGWSTGWMTAARCVKYHLACNRLRPLEPSHSCPYTKEIKWNKVKQVYIHIYI